MGRQGSQLAALKFQARGDGIGAPSHDALLVRQTMLAQARVNGLQISALWQGYEVVTSRMPDQILDAAFLPASMHIGKQSDPRDRRSESAETPHVRADDALPALAALLA